MKPQLIVIAKPEVGLRVSLSGITSAEGVDVTPLANLLASEGVTIQPLFGGDETQFAADQEDYGPGVPPPSVFFWVEAPEDRLDELAQRLNEDDAVDAAYVKPPAEPAVWSTENLVPSTVEPSVLARDFIDEQVYMGPRLQSSGINRFFVGAFPGITGVGVNIIDIEGDWNLNHEDLRLEPSDRVCGELPVEDPEDPTEWWNHGTAVAGVLNAIRRNGIGIHGICDDARLRVCSFRYRTDAPPGFVDITSRAIRDAANLLNRGDIILIELHRPGPRVGCTSEDGQRGFIAVEWWPDDYLAIRAATNRGVIVVEAAGNGGENLDDAIYNRPELCNTIFPNWWRNPFRRNPLDSGAILVGAGAPQPGTHGNNHGPARSRLDFSNWGSCLDAQGWGQEVTTTGYGDLQGGSEDRWYTNSFNGTSSASPIVVGALASTQGHRIASNRERLNSLQARNLLRATGAPQQDAPGRPSTQRIGNLPDLAQMAE